MPLPSPESLPVRSEPAPAKRDYRYRPVWRPKPGQPLRVTVLSTRPEGFIVHFVQGRSRPCHTNGECPYCRDTRLPSKWEGYVWATAQYGQIGIAVISAEAYRSCDELSDGKTNLRGMLLTLTRQGPHNNSRVAAGIQEGHARTLHLPAPGDLLQHMLHIWRMDKPGAAQASLDFNDASQGGPHDVRA